jgi:hypothetical protein
LWQFTVCLTSEKNEQGNTRKRDRSSHNQASPEEPARRGEEESNIDKQHSDAAHPKYWTLSGGFRSRVL